RQDQLMRRVTTASGRPSLKAVVVSAVLCGRHAILNRAVEWKPECGHARSSDRRSGLPAKRDERVWCDLLHECLEPEGYVITSHTNSDSVPVFKECRTTHSEVRVS